MLFLLFGPPGVGKSTLCETIGAVDLEDLCCTDERLAYAQAYIKRPGIILAGAADLNPKIFPEACYVALKMDEDLYSKRRSSRDKLLPDKANQDQFFISDFTENLRKIDLCIDASGDVNSTIKNLIKAVLDYCNKFGLEKVFVCTDVRQLNKKQIS